MKTRMFLPLFMLLSSAYITASEGKNQKGALGGLLTTACPLPEGTLRTAVTVVAVAAVTKLAIDNGHRVLAYVPTIATRTTRSATSSVMTLVPKAVNDLAAQVLSHIPAQAVPALVGVGVVYKDKALEVLTGAKNLVTRDVVGNTAALAGAALLVQAARNGSYTSAGIAGAVTALGLKNGSFINPSKEEASAN